MIYETLIISDYMFLIFLKLEEMNGMFLHMRYCSQLGEISHQKVMYIIQFCEKKYII
jgi:hypothetical protein